MISNVMCISGRTALTQSAAVARSAACTYELADWRYGFCKLPYLVPPFISINTACASVVPIFSSA
jgi:hypothetical protein